MSHLGAVPHCSRVLLGDCCVYFSGSCFLETFILDVITHWEKQPRMELILSSFLSASVSLSRWFFTDYHAFSIRLPSPV